MTSRNKNMIRTTRRIVESTSERIVTDAERAVNFGRRRRERGNQTRAYDRSFKDRFGSRGAIYLVAIYLSRRRRDGQSKENRATVRFTRPQVPLAGRCGNEGDTDLHRRHDFAQ